MLAVPTAASYPATAIYCPSAERERKPSEVAVPETVNLRLLPLTAVGSAMDCTNDPAVVYSSKKPAVAEFTSPATPSPARKTTKLPEVNAAPIAWETQIVITLNARMSLFIR
jgi:hypothetical protein